MKRLVLAASILAAGAALFSGFRHSAAQLRSEAAVQRGSWLEQTQRLGQVEMQHHELTVGIQELKLSLARRARGLPEDALAMGTDGTTGLSPDVRERLLAELGLDWKASAEYLVVSKDTLRQVNLNAVRDNRLRDTVCSVLAITPAERAEIDGTMERLSAEFNAWAQARVERTKPSGDVLAKYTLPPDPEFSQSLSNAFSGSVIAGLGAERGGLLLDYAREWMQNLGMRGEGLNMLTIKRAPAGREWPSFELRTPDNSRMSSEVTPHQTFPEVFRPIFPGGWVQVAEFEGFELPETFYQP